MATKTLNPKWLVAAVVTDEDGERFGTVCTVNGDKLIVLKRGVEHKMSAKALDAAGRISKPIASVRKYL